MSEQNTFIIDVDVKPLKAQLKDSVKELQAARQKFGEFSNEAITASKKVAAIKDAIDDANASAKLFDPAKKFQAITNAASMAAAGVSAVQGAMALFGNESEDVAKTLQKVQGAMALSQGLSQLKDIGQVGEELKLTFKGLTAGMSSFKKALISTGVGALVAGLGLLIANFDEVKKVVNNLFPGLAKFGSFVVDLTQKFTDFIGVTSKADRELEAFNKNNKARNEQLERDIKVLEATGGKEEEIAAKKKQISANELEGLKKKVDDKGKLYGEDAKKYKDLNADIAAVDAAESKRKADKAKEQAEKDRAKREKDLQLAKEHQEKVNEAESILREANGKLKSEKEQEILAVEEQYREKRKKLAEAGVKDTGVLANAEAEEKKKIVDKYNKEEEDKQIEFQHQLNSIIAEAKLAGIKDENERAKQELIANYIDERAEIDANEKLTAEQKTALKIALAQKEATDLDNLKLAQDQKKAEQDIADLDKEIAKEMAKNDFKFQAEKDLLDKKDALLKESYDKGLINDRDYTIALEANTNARMAISQKEAEAKSQLLQMIGQALTQAGDLVGKETGVGKTLAVAGALINTYQGIAAGVKLGYPLAIPAVAMASMTGFAAVKNILSVKVPKGGGASGGGGAAAPSVAAAAPSMTPQVPTLGSSPVTALSSVMSAQAPLKAFVVESEVTSSQKRVSDIERRAGF